MVLWPRDESVILSARNVIAKLDPKVHRYDTAPAKHRENRPVITAGNAGIVYAKRSSNNNCSITVNNIQLTPMGATSDNAGIIY
jgi:hypothetical protein